MIAQATVEGCLTPEGLTRNINGLFDNNAAVLRTTPGVYIQQRNESDRTWVDLFKLRHDEYHTPASNNKVLTTAAIITALGPHHEIKTPVTGMINGGNVPILCIAGKGDPSMTPQRLQSMVQHLQSQGISSISQLILDDSYFQPDFPDGWEWGDLPYYYGAAPSSFILDENVITVQVSPGASVGAPLQVTFPYPADSNSAVANTIYSTTGPAGSASTVDVSWRIGKTDYFVIGSLPLGSKPVSMAMAVIDTTNRFSYMLSYYLSQSGISSPRPVKGSCSASTAPILYHFSSDSLGSMVNHTLQVSDNLMAEVWSRTLGALSTGQGSAPSKGISAVSGVLAQLGVVPSSFRQRDGSGLDSANLVSPWALLNTVKAMGQGGYASQYKSYLPNSYPGGELYSRYIGTPAVGRVFAKTGYISLVSSLSGWVDDNKLFSIMLDQSPTPSATRKKLIDTIVVWIADLCPLH
jgi:D-alanyl-D-alanine carboxypeptidase/D-alanyl-D-alanine-endopeptidase (penicillin-binding protein 4)